MKSCSWWSVLRYFLWLGTFGFGGPVALIGYMQRDLVEKKGWLSRDVYLHGLALAGMCPGPLATQLAIYFGWLKGRFLGASIVAIAFILPSFCMVVGFAALYMHHTELSWIHSALYGIGAAVVAIIIKSAIKIARLTCQNKALLWLIFASLALFTPLYSSYTLWMFLISGCITMWMQSPSSGTNNKLHAVPFLLTSISSALSKAPIIQLGLYFAWAGAFVFGSGLAIIPFLHDGVVNQYAWLTNGEFLDAVAVGMITPGPVVITAAFIGYLVAGFAGACVAAFAIITPCFLFVVCLAPFYQKLLKNRAIAAFVTGITAAAAGAIAGSSVIIGKQALIDTNSVIIFLISASLLLFKKIPEPLIIVFAGLAGYIFHLLT